MLDIPGDNTIDPTNMAVTNIIIIKGINAISYGFPAKTYSNDLDKAAMPSAAGIQINDVTFNNIFMLDLKAILLSSEKNADNLGTNKFDIGKTSIVAALAIINAKLYTPKYDKLIKYDTTILSKYVALVPIIDEKNNGIE